MQLLIIYIDAGWGKLTSPDAAWSVRAEVGALDTYMRHTPTARYARYVLGGTALARVRVRVRARARVRVRVRVRD